MNESKLFKLSIGKNITGSPLSITGYRFKKGNGPSFYIQGGTHGGEITFFVFKLLNDFLKNSNDWSGTVTLVPLSHPISWNQRFYYHTAGKFNFCDGKDWNRSFPGNPNGTTAERISDVVFSEAKKHDVTIDLHTSRRSNPFFIISRNDLIQQCINSGIAPIYLAPVTSNNQPLPDAIDKIGKRGFTIECGSHDSPDTKNAKMCFEAILNLMRGEKLLTDKNSKPSKSKCFVFTEYKTYLAPTSGFVEYIHPLEKNIKKDDVLYYIHPSDSLDEKFEITAKEDCIIMKYQTTHAATIGDEIVTVVAKDNIKKADHYSNNY